MLSGTRDLQGDRNVLKVDFGDITQVFQFRKNCGTVQLKEVKSMVCKSDLNKALRIVVYRKKR